MDLHTIIIIIITIFLILIFCVKNKKDNNHKKENFNPYLDYTRAYPGTMSLRKGFAPSHDKYYKTWPGNFRYNPGYGDYWYIPASNYLDNWINGRNVNFDPNGCIVPPITNNACVSKKVQNTGNLDLSIAACTIPATLKDICPRNSEYISPYDKRNNYSLFNNWYQPNISSTDSLGSPFLYQENDYINLSQIYD